MLRYKKIFLTGLTCFAGASLLCGLSTSIWMLIVFRAIHKGYISRAKKWDWLHKRFVLDLLTVQKAEQMRRYKQFVAQDADHELLRVLERPYLPPILGSEKFLGWIKERFFEQKSHQEAPASKGLAPDNKAILGALGRFY